MSEIALRMDDRYRVSEELEYIRELGRQQREEALAEQQRKYDNWAFCNTMDRLADKDARRPTQLAFWKRFNE